MPSNMVHHVDGNPKNNEDGNLQAMSMDCHRKHHAKGGAFKESK